MSLYKITYIAKYNSMFADEIKVLYTTSPPNDWLRVCRITAGDSITKRFEEDEIIVKNITIKTVKTVRGNIAVTKEES